MQYFYMLQMLKLNNKKWKKTSFYEEKHLVGTKTQISQNVKYLFILIFNVEFFSVKYCRIKCLKISIQVKAVNVWRKNTFFWGRFFISLSNEYLLTMSALKNNIRHNDSINILKLVKGKNKIETLFRFT